MHQFNWLVSSAQAILIYIPRRTMQQLLPPFAHRSHHHGLLLHPRSLLHSLLPDHRCRSETTRSHHLPGCRLPSTVPVLLGCRRPSTVPVLLGCRRPPTVLLLLRG